MKTILSFVLFRIVIFALVVSVGLSLWTKPIQDVDVPERYSELESYTLPADIMQVEFANEVWVYRLYRDQTCKKIVMSKGNVNGYKEGGKEIVPCKLSDISKKDRNLS